MQISDQKALRWEPLSDLPETSCSDIAITSLESGKLLLVLQYGNPNRDLALDFSEVIAFRIYWDGDGVRLRDECEVPMCDNATAPSAWPLIEVINSRLLAGDDLSFSREIARMLGQKPWRHFHIVSEERHVEVIARGEIVASWLAHNS